MKWEVGEYCFLREDGKIEIIKTESDSERKQNHVEWSKKKYLNLHIPVPYTYIFFLTHNFSILNVPERRRMRYVFTNDIEACKHIPIQLSYKDNYDSIETSTANKHK